MVTQLCIIFSQKLQMKQQVADAFLARFQLTPNEVRALRGAKAGALSQVRQVLSVYPFSFDGAFQVWVGFLVVECLDIYLLTYSPCI